MWGVFRCLFSLIGAFFALINPSLPIFYICVAVILVDCYTAWSLSRRVKRTTGKSSGVFKSEYAGRVIVTIIKAFVAIVLAFFIQKHIICSDFMDLSKVVAGAICFWQIWSILENESSCNNSKWAKIAQKIMVDKTSRHFDIDLSELNKEDK
jgi:hypothetical protein